MGEGSELGEKLFDRWLEKGLGRGILWGIGYLLIAGVLGFIAIAKLQERQDGRKELKDARRAAATVTDRDEDDGKYFVSYELEENGKKLEGGPELVDHKTYEKAKKGQLIDVVFEKDPRNPTAEEKPRITASVKSEAKLWPLLLWGGGALLFILVAIWAFVAGPAAPAEKSND